jgi:hypothetical protein
MLAECVSAGMVATAVIARLLSRRDKSLPPAPRVALEKVPQR